MWSETLKRNLTFFAVLLFAWQAYASGVTVDLVWTNQARGVYMITLCDGQSTTDACDTVGDGTGTVIAHRFDGAYTYTAIGTQSVGDYSCDFYSNDTGYDADAADVQKINPVSLTHTNQMISFAGLFYNMWVECPTANDVTITLLSAPLAGK